MAYNIFLQSIEQISKYTPQQFAREIDEFIMSDSLIEKVHTMLGLLLKKEEYELCAILKKVLDDYNNAK